jgi:hypothetical protein
MTMLTFIQGIKITNIRMKKLVVALSSLGINRATNYRSEKVEWTELMPLEEEEAKE